VSTILALTRSRLAAAIVAPVFLLALMVTAAVLGYAYVLVAQHDDEQAHRTAILVTALVTGASGSFHSPDGLQEFVARLATDGPASEVVVAAGQPLTVVASAHAHERGLTLDQIADAELAAQVTAFAMRGGSGAVDVGDGRTVIHVRRVELQLTPTGESGPGPAFIGVRLDLAPLHWLSSSRAASFVAWTVGASLIVVWMGLLILRRRVFDPLQAIERAVHARRAGDRAARIHIDSTDEFAEVAAELNAAMDDSAAREDEERAVRMQIVTARTRWQQALSYDLHDHVGGDLGGLAFRAKALAERLKAQSRPEARAADELTRALGAVADRTRALSQMLAPTSPEHGGLVVALSRLCQSTATYSGIDVALREADPLPVIADWRANHVFLIVQEALRNAVKHGRSSRVRVSLFSRPREIVFRITSVQRPWDPDRQSDGLGMRIVKFRAKTLNAALRVDVRRSGITRVQLTVPVEADSALPETTVL
jgi:signal transduction histidine kinase